MRFIHAGSRSLREYWRRGSGGCGLEGTIIKVVHFYPTHLFAQCEADLPESLRFGRVEVSCEGWSGPGDSHVLKGST